PARSATSATAGRAVRPPSSPPKPKPKPPVRLGAGRAEHGRPGGKPCPPQNRAPSMFTDVVTVQVRAGHGGRGSASFRAQPFEPQGGPDGGNGGAGGDVVFEATRDLDDLTSLAGRHRLAANPGQAGAGGRKEGRRAADLVVRVPVGTAVYDESGELVADLARD